MSYNVVKERIGLTKAGSGVLREYLCLSMLYKVRVEIQQGLLSLGSPFS